MKTVDFLLDLIFPNRCLFCDKVISWDKPYHEECFNKLEYTKDDYCDKCGQKPCACKYKEGQRVLPYYDTCMSVVYYKTSARELLLNFKYGNTPNASEFIAKMIYDKLMEEYDFVNPIIVPVPMLKADKRKRGYNQAELIAKHLAKLSGFELNSKSLVKVKKTNSQKRLSETERRKNLIKAFEVKDKSIFSEREIILVDDVITTGATLNECAKMIKRAGAEKVNAVVFAATSFS